MSVWLDGLLWEQEAVGSNPTIPTNLRRYIVGDVEIIIDGVKYVLHTLNFVTKTNTLYFIYKKEFAERGASLASTHNPS